MIIENPTPITPAEMSKMWVANLRLQMPDPVFTQPIFPQSKGSFSARLLPYDGIHLLATGAKTVNIPDLKTKREADTAFDTTITAICAEVQRQAAKTVAVNSVTVIANDPTKPVVLRVEFVDKTQHVIADCFALAGTDSIFAEVFNSAMTKVARLAGLAVS